MATEQIRDGLFGQGMCLLRTAEENGGITPETLVEILESRRALLSTQWRRRIWQEIGGCPVPSKKKCVGQLLLFTAGGFSLGSKGVFAKPVETEKGVVWGGLLRAKLQGEKVVEEAKWCVVSIEWGLIPHVVRVDASVSVQDLIAIYGTATDLITWLSDKIYEANMEAQEEVHQIGMINDDFYFQDRRIFRR